MSIVVSDFLRLVLSEIRIARAGDVLSANDQADALTLFNELLDMWNAQGRALYNNTVTSWTLTPGHQPHTIGPSGADFTTAIARPVAITNANLILSGTTPIRLPIEVHRDVQWWMSVPAPTIQTAIPSDLYYDPAWPTGNCWLWPVPNFAYQFEASSNTLLASVAATDTLNLPMGYQLALRLTMAETCAEMWGQPISPSLQMRAQRARAAGFGNNRVIPPAVPDAGLPLGGQRGGTFNYLTGMME